MIHTLHTTEDLIYAYVVFRTVDINGKAKNEGLYIYVENIWISNSYRGGEVLKELIEHIDQHPECKNAKWVYWQREKYNDRVSKPYERSRFIKEMAYGKR